MAKTTSSFDATPSALGYLYQCRCALLYALQRDDEPTVQVSIEQLDDVAFEDSSTPLNPVEMLQLKHHATLNRQSSLGDKSLDIWKTLRVWSQAILDGKVDLMKSAFFLVTTSVATNRNSVRYLRANKDRDPNAALKALETAGATSKDDDVTKAHKIFMSLSNTKRTQLFEAVTLLDGEEDILDMRPNLERAVRFAVSAQFRSAFLDRLEGWWFRVVVEHLMSPTGGGIFISEIHRQIDELRGQFQRENLPDDFLDSAVPDDAAPTDDQRIFIKQLALIGLSEERVKSAQTDHYKAFTQRSRWVKDNLLDLQELAQFEGRLTDEWRTRFLILLELLLEDDEEIVRMRKGVGLYNWTQTDAPGHASLLIRPEFRAQYMTRGSYHMLADQKRVGWHPEFESRLSATNGGAPEAEDASD